MHSFYSTPYTNTHFHYYKPLIPVRTGVLFPDRSPITKGLRYDDHEARRQEVMKKLALFKTSIKNEDANNNSLYWSFVYYFNAINSTNIWNDIVKYSCWCCDHQFNSKEIETHNKAYREAVKSNNIQSMIDELEKIQKAKKWSTWFYENSYIKWGLPFLVISAYFIVYVLLIVFYQDTALCWQFQNSLNPNNHEVEVIINGSKVKQMVDQCYELRSEKCIIHTLGTQYNIFEYARLRVAMYTLSFIPFIFLYVCMQYQLNYLLKRMDPNRKDYHDPDPLKPLGNSTERRMKKSGFWELHTGIIKLAHVYIFIFVNAGTFIVSMILDVNAVQSLEDCDSKYWALYLKDNQPRRIPEVLVSMNGIAAFWGFIYIMSKIFNTLSKNNNRDADLIIDIADADNMTVAHTTRAKQDHAAITEALQSDLRQASDRLEVLEHGTNLQERLRNLRASP